MIAKPLSIIDIQYYINEEKQCVVCMLEARIGADFYTFKGKSTCHPDDEFNETLGEKLALNRAKYKLFCKISDLCAKKERQHEQLSSEYRSLRAKYSMAAFTEQSYRKKLLKND